MIQLVTRDKTRVVVDIACARVAVRDAAVRRAAVVQVVIVVPENAVSYRVGGKPAGFDAVSVVIDDGAVIYICRTVTEDDTVFVVADKAVIYTSVRALYEYCLIAVFFKDAVSNDACR